jgi:hypothetical protein
LGNALNIAEIRAVFDSAPGHHRIRHLAHPVLVQIDSDMHQRERARRKGERTVRMGVGIYRFEEDAPPRRAPGVRRRESEPQKDMKRIPKSYGRRRSVPRPAPSALESQARAAMRSFVRVLARRGCAPRDLEQQLVRACREIPESWLHEVEARDPGAPAHVLTLWFSDPAYLDALGNPKPLPLRGRNSIETLAPGSIPVWKPGRCCTISSRGGGCGAPVDAMSRETVS